MDGSHIIEHPHVTNNTDNITEAKFPPLTSTAIEKIGKIIPWALGKFLEGLIPESVEELSDKIKEGDYSFLGIYLDFLTIKKSIKQLDDEELKEECYKVR